MELSDNLKSLSLESWPWRHPFLVFFASILVFVAAFLSWNAIYHATKIKDPNDPRFNQAKFRFEDYPVKLQDERVISNQDVLTKLLPIGEKKSNVDSLLIGKLKAKEKLIPDASYEQGQSFYFYKIPFNPLRTEAPFASLAAEWLSAGGNSVLVLYDQNQKLIKMIVHVPK